MGGKEATEESEVEPHRDLETELRSFAFYCKCTGRAHVEKTGLEKGQNRTRETL